MNTIKNAANNVATWARTRYDKCKGAYYGTMAAVTTGVLAAPALASGTGSTASINGVFTQIMGILYDIAKFMGVGIVAYAIFSWILAMKDDNADGQSRAIRFLVVGIALTLLGTIAGPIVNSLLTM